MTTPYQELQTAQQRVADLIAAPLANLHKSTIVTAQEMRDMLAVPYIDGRLELAIGGNWVTGVASVDGTALAKFAAGAFTVPGITLVNEQIGIQWNNHATPDPIGTTFFVPYDLDVTQAATLFFLAHKVGATLADAVTWVVTAFSVGDADLADSDADFGGTSSAMTGNAATKTCQLESLAIGANTLTNGDSVTITVQPTDGTLGTDDVVLQSVYLAYKKRTTA